MKFLKNPYIWLFILSLAYFAIRLTDLKALPIFTDEAIYIRWSQIGATDASWRFISLTDGKQPLFTWFLMASLRLINDPLFAGRIVSVFSGFVAMIGMYVLTYEIFKRKSIALFSSFLYVISPFTLMYDRMALYDSLVAACSIWNLYIAILLVRYIRLDIALIFGLSLGAGMLNKTSGFLSLYLLPFTLLLFDWKKRNVASRLFSWIGLSLVSLVLSQLVYSILRLSPYFYIVAQKNTIFVYPFSEWMLHPFTFLYGNLHGQFDWLIHYMTIPVCLTVIASFFVSRKNFLEKALLVLWWMAPFIGLALFGKVLYPRFILFMTMPLYMLSAYTLGFLYDKISSKLLSLSIIIAVVGQSAWLSYGVVSDIKHVAIPKSERGQYINDWPAGWGVSEIVELLASQSRLGPVSVYTEGTFGLLPYALEIYLHSNKNIQIQGVWPPPLKVPDYINESAKKRTTFYITNFTQTVPDWPMDKIAEYQKGINTDSYIRMYKIIYSNDSK